MESTTGYTFTPCVGSFTSPGIDTRYIGGSRGGPGGHVPPRAFEKKKKIDEYFCWCTCLAKLAYRFMNIAGDERMCGK